MTMHTRHATNTPPSHRALRAFACLAIACGLTAHTAFGQVAPATTPPAAPKAPAAPAAPAAPKAPATPAAPAPAAAPAAPKPAAKQPAITPVEFAGETPTAQAIFQKHLDATGGSDAWKGKTSMNATGAMRLAALGIDAPMAIKACLPNLMAITIELPQQGTTRVGYNGIVGWSIDPMRGPLLLSETELADFRRRADIHRDMRLANEPGKATVAGAAEFNGAKVWQVKIIDEDGSESTNLYDQSSGLLVGTALTAKTAMGDIPVVVTIGEYSDFDGVRLPARTVMWMMMQAQELLTKTVEWNTLTATDFELPKEIAALVKARDAAPAKPADAASPSAPGAPANPSTPANPPKKD